MRRSVIDASGLADSVLNWYGEGLSYRGIAERLSAAHGIKISHEGVSKWLKGQPRDTDGVDNGDDLALLEAAEIDAGEDAYQRLKPRQQRFVDEYLCDLNSTQAAIRSGYSPATAGQIGNALLKNVDVSAAISQRMALRSRRTGISGDLVIEELAILGRATMADFVDYTPTGVTLKPLANIDPRLQRAIAEVTQTATVHGVNVRIKLHDKLGSLTLLGKHLNMFTDRVEHTGRDGGPIELSAIQPPSRVDQDLDQLFALGREVRSGTRKSH